MRILNSSFIISALFLLVIVFPGSALCNFGVGLPTPVNAQITTGPGSESFENILFENGNGLRNWNMAGAGLLSPVAVPRIFAADGGPNDQFGSSLAAGGDTMAVGVPNRSSVYIFVWNGAQWAQQAKLSVPGIRFGASVAIQGDTLMVGASGDTITQTGQGSVYVFTRSGTVWTEQQRLVGPNALPGSNLGESLAIDGDTLIAGAPNYYNPGDQPIGAVYIFVKTGGVWQSQGFAMFAFFGSDNPRDCGRTVAIKGDTIAFGCPLEGTSPPNPDPNHNHGAVYVYKRTGAEWFAQVRILPADNKYADFFGSGLGFLSGGTLLAGAKGAGPLGARTGAVYVYSGDGANWAQVQKLFPSDMIVDGNFGNNIAAEGDRLLIGTLGENIVPTFGAGVAYTFQRSGGAWSEVAKLYEPDAEQDNQFGSALAVSGDRFFTGAANTRVNGNFHQGAAYVYTNPSAVPDLQPSSDTGISSADNLTNSRSPSFNIPNLTVGSLVELLRDDTAIASATVTTPTMTLQDTAPPANGTFRYTSRQTVAGQPGSPGAPLVVVYDTIAPVLTIRHDGPDPVNSQNLLNFRALMNEPGFGFETADVSLAGSTANVSAATVEFFINTVNINYDIKVRNVLSDGVVMVTVPAGAITDAAGNFNTGTTTTDNTITYDTTPPVATVEQAPSQADPATTFPIVYNVTFNEPIDRFGSGGGNITVAGSPAGVLFAQISTQGSGLNYTSTVTNVIGDNQAVIARVAQGGCVDLAGNPCAPSISKDNSVTVNNAILRVTIDQAATQPDPATSMPINFTIVCSQHCSQFFGDPISLAGSTADVSQATISITGASPTLNVAIGNVMSGGEVRASVNGYALIDMNNHPSAPSRSVDNVVTYSTGVSEITGQIRTSTGRYVLNGFVEVTLPGGEKRYTRATPLGYYRLRDVPHGNITIKFLSKNYQTVTQNIALSGNVTGLNPTLTPNYGAGLIEKLPEEQLWFW